MAEGRAAGASAWDGYAAAAVSEATVEALRSGRPVDVALDARPALYGADAELIRGR
jgi:myo-inositol 2-dehydrogenase / D-chiro-inositol 1-dehydrogenase